MPTLLNSALVALCILSVGLGACSGSQTGANIVAPSPVTALGARLGADAVLIPDEGSRLSHKGLAPTTPSIVFVSPASTDKVVSRTFLVRIQRTDIDLPLSLVIDKGPNACDGSGAAGYPVQMDQDEMTITLDTYNFPSGTWFGLCVYRPFVASTGDRRIRVE